MQTFTADSLPTGDWREYRKTATTKMVRVDGPFTVETREGPLSCDDGFVALDADGQPYPIDADVQARTYEPSS